MKQESIQPGRKVYEKPRLRIVPLAAEEVLAVGCKTSSGGFNVGGTPCMANQCNKRGS